MFNTQNDSVCMYVTLDALFSAAIPTFFYWELQIVKSAFTYCWYQEHGMKTWVHVTTENHTNVFVNNKIIHRNKKGKIKSNICIMYRDEVDRTFVEDFF